MGLSRRQFTKDFKLAAVRRLEQGVSIDEVANWDLPAFAGAGALRSDTRDMV